MGTALPPIIEKIEVGAFVEMADLLPEHLGLGTMENEGKLTTQAPNPL